MTKEYVQRKAELLVKDHNHYNSVGYKAAAEDYRTALDSLFYVAGRMGWKFSYTVSKTGDITLD